MAKGIKNGRGYGRETGERRKDWGWWRSRSRRGWRGEEDLGRREGRKKSGSVGWDWWSGREEYLGFCETGIHVEGIRMMMGYGVGFNFWNFEENDG